MNSDNITVVLSIERSKPTGFKFLTSTYKCFEHEYVVNS